MYVFGVRESNKSGFEKISALKIDEFAMSKLFRILGRYRLSRKYKSFVHTHAFLFDRI